MTRLQCHASSSVELILLLAWLCQLSAQRRLAWQACGTAQRYSAPEGGNRLNDQVHSSPERKRYDTNCRQYMKTLTSMTSSKTTKAVPFVFGSFPIRN